MLVITAAVVDVVVYDWVLLFFELSLVVSVLLVVLFACLICSLLFM